MIIKRIVKKIKKYFLNFKQKSQSEDEYYEGLFIKHESWNKPTPNKDELKRWEIIEYFVNKIELKDQSNILDLGCGRGWLSNLLSSYGKVLGIEPVGNVVKYARSLFPDINFVEGKATTLLNQYSGKFDLIVSSEVIEHVLDNEKDKFVYEVNSLLNSNGYLIVSTPRKEAQIEWLKFSNPNQPIEDWISEKELKDLFEKRGFRLLESKRIPMKLKKHTDFIDLYQVCLLQKKA